MTGQTLIGLENFPQERTVIASSKVRVDSTIIQSDLDLLNNKKADIDKENVFTEKQSFQCGVVNKVTNVSSSVYALSDSVNFIAFDTTSNSITVSLPEASQVIGQKFRLYLDKKSSSNVVNINCSSGDTITKVGGTSLTLTNIGDIVEIMAISSNTWIALNIEIL